MSDRLLPAPPPLPVRRGDIAIRYLRLGEIAEAVRAGTYRVPCHAVAVALGDEVAAHCRQGNGHRRFS